MYLKLFLFCGQEGERIKGEQKLLQQLGNAADVVEEVRLELRKVMERCNTVVSPRGFTRAGLALPRDSDKLHGVEQLVCRVQERLP